WEAIAMATVHWLLAARLSFTTHRPTSTHFLHFPRFPKGSVRKSSQPISPHNVTLRSLQKLPSQKTQKGKRRLLSFPPPLGQSVRSGLSTSCLQPSRSAFPPFFPNRFPRFPNFPKGNVWQTPEAPAPQYLASRSLRKLP